MSGLADLVERDRNPVAPLNLKDSAKTVTGAKQKAEQKANADANDAALKTTADNANAKAVADAEAARRASIMPAADDAAGKAAKRRAAAASAASGGRDSTILTGQRLGD